MAYIPPMGMEDRGGGTNGAIGMDANIHILGCTDHKLDQILQIWIQIDR